MVGRAGAYFGAEIQKDLAMRRVGRVSGSRRLLPGWGLGVVFLLAVLAGALLGIVPGVLCIGYLVLSGASYFAYWWDKAAAGKGRQRTPESTLHLVDMLGGWPGALVAQQQFRHKTVKASFQAVFLVTVVVNIALEVWLVHSGSVRALTDALL
jgi:uncharacterized membrane protein YsdA (DUF1294 family)